MGRERPQELWFGCSGAVEPAQPLMSSAILKQLEQLEHFEQRTYLVERG